MMINGFTGFEMVILIICVILLFLIWRTLNGVFHQLHDLNRDMNERDCSSQILGKTINIEEHLQNLSDDIEVIKDDFKDYKEKKFPKNDYEDYIP